MRKLLFLLTLVMGFAFATSPLAVAQSDVDIETIARTVLDADQKALMTGLETPMTDQDLPEGFSGAAYVDPETATGDEGVLPASELEGAEGSVAYMIDWAPTGASGSPEASPVASGFAVRIATLNYVFFADEITAGDLEDFKSGAEEGLSAEQDAETTISDIEIGGVQGVLLTYVLEESGVQSVVQMVALPVGNTLVISMLVEAGQKVDADAVQAASENLTIAGSEYLGTVAEDAR